MSSEIDNIKARRAKITQGEWKRDPYDRPSMQVIAHNNEVIVYHGRHERQVDAQVVPNFDFIAHAPADIDFLLKRVEELEAAMRIIKPHWESIAGIYFAPSEDAAITAELEKVTYEQS
jgi:hypothetical protein